MYFVAFGVFFLGGGCIFLFCTYVHPFLKCRIFLSAFSHLPAVVCLSQWVPVRDRDRIMIVRASAEIKESPEGLLSAGWAHWSALPRTWTGVSVLPEHQLTGIRRGGGDRGCVWGTWCALWMSEGSADHGTSCSADLEQGASLLSFLRLSWRAQNRRDWHSSLQWRAVLTGGGPALNQIKISNILIKPVRSPISLDGILGAVQWSSHPPGA